MSTLLEQIKSVEAPEDKANYLLSFLVNEGKLPWQKHYSAEEIGEALSAHKASVAGHKDDVSINTVLSGISTVMTEVCAVAKGLAAVCSTMPPA